MHFKKIQLWSLIGYLLILFQGLYANDTLFVTNSGSDHVAVIDLNTNSLITTIEVGDMPRGIAITPDGTTAFVANFSGGSVTPINLSTLSPLSLIVTGGSGPNGVAISPNGEKVYVSNTDGNNVTIINTSDRSVSATVSVGTLPRGIAFTPDGTKAYVANSGSANITIITVNSPSVKSTISLSNQPEYIAMSPDGTKAYVTLDNGGSAGFVSIINTATNAITGTVTVGVSPLGIVVTPDGTKAYVTNNDDNTVSIINLNSESPSVIATLDVGSAPLLNGVRPDGTAVYVPNQGPDTISVINNSTNSVSTTFSSEGTDPWQVVITPLASPISFSGKQFINNFGVASELFNKLTWFPSTSNVSGYEIARNGVVIALLDASARSYEDHNRPPHTVTTYTLTAFHNSGSRSASSTISVGG